METTPTQRTMMWQVSGMHCSSCSILIDEAVEELEGVTSSNTSLKRKLTTVTFDATRCDADRIAATIVDAGYRAVPSADAPASARRSWFRRTTA